MPGDGWQEEYKERVLAEFKRVHEDIEKVDKNIDTLKETMNSELRSMDVKIAVIEQENKDKARSAGMLYGAITSLIISVFGSLIVYAILHGAK